MHDVLDPRDLVPDEAEELIVSGYPAAALLEAARAAASGDDQAALSNIETRLASLERDSSWPYVEDVPEHELSALCSRLRKTSYDPATYADRVRGAWLGRTAGNTIGKPIEGLDAQEVEAYLRAAGQIPLRGYLPLVTPLPDGVTRLHPSAPLATAGAFGDVPRDDDIDWTIVGLHLLESRGTGFSTEDVAVAWLDRVPFTQTYTAERAAYRNLVHGLRAPDTATTRNPYREWIGALIRVDAYGYTNPGDPGAAASLALRDARLSHTGNGVYGAMWAAALVAAAFTADSARDAIEQAAEVVPPRSRLGVALRHVLELFDSGASHEDALQWIDSALGHYAWVHTINNAALIATGVLWGTDFLGGVGIAIEGGRDTDSNGATVGSVLGALHGSVVLPDSLRLPEPVRVRSAVRDFDRITIDELTERTIRLTEQGLHDAPS